MAWKYDVATRAFSLNGVHKFYAEYAGAVIPGRHPPVVLY